MGSGPLEGNKPTQERTNLRKIDQLSARWKTKKAEKGLQGWAAADLGKKATCRYR